MCENLSLMVEFDEGSSPVSFPWRDPKLIPRHSRIPRHKLGDEWDEPLLLRRYRPQQFSFVNSEKKNFYLDSLGKKDLKSFAGSAFTKGAFPPRLWGCLRTRQTRPKSQTDGVPS
jgi:hypothetical protein